MDNKTVSVTIPRYITPVRVDCDCRRKQLDLEFKTVTLQWIKKTGEPVRKGELLCEGEVEKLFFEIRSPVDGILSDISVMDEETCEIHSPIGFIEAAEE